MRARRIVWLAPGLVIAGAVIVAWWVPTTGTAVSCGDRGCIVVIHHGGARLAIIAIGALIGWIVLRAGSTDDPTDRGSILLAVLGLVVSGVALAVAVRFPVGYRPMDRTGISTDAWFDFRVIVGIAGIMTIAAVSLTLWMRGASGAAGLRVLAFGVPAICALTAFLVPRRPTCPPGAFFPDASTWSCVDVSRSTGLRSPRCRPRRRASGSLDAASSSAAS